MFFGRKYPNVIEIETGQVYKVVKILTDHDYRSPSCGQKVAQMERLIDGYRRRESMKNLNESFRAIEGNDSGSMVATDNGTRSTSPTTARPPNEHDTSPLGTLIEPAETDSFDQLVFEKSVTSGIRLALDRLNLSDFLVNEWGLKKTIGNSTRRSTILFEGGPGLGKTSAALAIARLLNKKLFIADIAQITSKYYSESSKNIRALFKFATESSSVFLIDEADSLFSKRLDASDSVGVSINQERAVLMDEILKFSGLLIACTNLGCSIDAAIGRRLLAKVHFSLPNVDQRLKVLQLKLPAEVPTKDVDLALIARMTEGMSHDDLKNIIESALVMAASEYSDDRSGERRLRQDHLIAQVHAMRAGKIIVGAGSERRVMGFATGSEDG